MIDLRTQFMTMRWWMMRSNFGWSKLIWKLSQCVTMWVISPTPLTHSTRTCRHTLQTTTSMPQSPYAPHSDKRTVTRMSTCIQPIAVATMYIFLLRGFTETIPLTIYGRMETAICISRVHAHTKCVCKRYL